jgi:hypothetical protein
MTCHAIYWQKTRTKSKEIDGSDRPTGGCVCQRVNGDVCLRATVVCVECIWLHTAECRSSGTSLIGQFFTAEFTAIYSPCVSLVILRCWAMCYKLICYRVGVNEHRVVQRRNITNEMHIQSKVNRIFRISMLLLHVSALYERHLQGVQRILMKLCICYFISAKI